MVLFSGWKGEMRRDKTHKSVGAAAHSVRANKKKRAHHWWVDVTSGFLKFMIMIMIMIMKLLGGGHFA